MTQSLLSALCDAVVTLGPDLSVAHPAPKLNSLLLRNTRSMEGQSFLDLMTPDERERFQNFVNSISSSAANMDQDWHNFGAEPAQAITLHLLDGLHNRVPVQIFHTCLSDSA